MSPSSLVWSGQAVGEQTWDLPHGEEISGKLLLSKEPGRFSEDTWLWYRIGRLWVFVGGAKEAPQRGCLCLESRAGCVQAPPRLVGGLRPPVTRTLCVLVPEAMALSWAPPGNCGDEDLKICSP